jgi:LuxR family maltose regulon positive regulatory protein
LLHSSQPLSLQTPIESILTVLINDLSSIRGDFIVILDDYHLIESQQINDGITYLLEHMPVQMHLVISSRADPPLPLARFRGKGIMLEIGADDLRFTLDEAAALLKETEALELSTEDVSSLNAHTEGWVVGLKMAALSMRGQKDISGFINDFTGSQRYIMDYLMEEVLQKQTEEVRDFLMKTSVLERLYGPLCDAVTGHKGSQDTLLNLERGHLFIAPLDESRQWYRYEHLFADILRHQCGKTYGIEEGTELHIRASQWYEDNTLLDDAIHHALIARDWERAMKLILDYNPTDCGWNITLYNWLKEIPEEILHTNVQLYLQYVTLSAVVQPDDAEDSLKYLEQLAPEDNHIQGSVASIRMTIAFIKGDYTHSTVYGKEALSLLPIDDNLTRGNVSASLGSIYIDRNLYLDAEPHLQEAYDCFQRIGAIHSTISPLTYLGVITLARSKLHQAAKLFRQAIDVDERSPSTEFAHLFISLIFYDWNDLETAVSYVESAIELNRLSGNLVALERAYLYLFQYRLAQGDEVGASEALHEADCVLTKIKYFPPVHACNAAYHIILALAQNDSESASAWVEKLSESEFLPPDTPPTVIPFLLFRIRKSTMTERWRADYERMVNAGLESYTLFLRISQALDAPTPAEALPFLSEALTIAKPENRIRAFADHGKSLLPLIRLAISQGIEAEFADKLLTTIEAEEQYTLKRKETALSPAQEILSKREIEVLGLLAKGLSNRQIAERLIVSLSTAKTHIHNIMEKLEARSRTQAIARARELKLV